MYLNKSELQSMQEIIFLNKIIENNLSENTLDRNSTLQQLQGLQQKADAILSKINQSLSGTRKKMKDAELLEALFVQYENRSITMAEILSKTSLKKRAVYNRLRKFRENIS